MAYDAVFMEDLCYYRLILSRVIFSDFMNYDAAVAGGSWFGGKDGVDDVC